MGEEQVFAAWLDAQIMHTAFFGSITNFEHTRELEPEVGGNFVYEVRLNSVDRDHCGQYLELIPPNELVFTWRVNLVEFLF